LAPQEKYEIWMQLVRGETTVAEAAERARVDRATIAKLREVAKAGALDALAQSRPGRRGSQRDVELEEAKAEAERLRTALAEMAVRLTLAEGKEPWG
jgi:transposase-like protein